MKKRVVSFCFLTSLFLPLVLVAQTPPDEFLGHRVGADRKLADYEQIQVYFRQLAEESAKIQDLDHWPIDLEQAHDHGCHHIGKKTWPISINIGKPREN